MTHAIVLMGVAGSGKTTIGQALSAELGWPFFDGDDYHPTENVTKMAQGMPLNDEDRAPWLQTLTALIQDHAGDGQPLIVACSALKERYRQQLMSGNRGLEFVYLCGDFELIQGRMAARADHYMEPGMLASQFEILEEPAEALVVDVDQSLPAIVAAICEGLGLVEGGERFA